MTLHDLFCALYIVAAVCFLLAAANVTTTRVNLLALGLLAAVLVPTIATIRS